MNEVDKLIDSKPVLTNMMNTFKQNNMHVYYYYRQSMYVYLVASYVLKSIDREDDIRFLDGEILKMMVDKVNQHDAGFLEFEDNFFYNGNMDTISKFVRQHIVYKKLMIEFDNDPDIIELFVNEPYFTLKR
jgi:hypothetical protein